MKTLYTFNPGELLGFGFYVSVLPDLSVEYDILELCAKAGCKVLVHGDSIRIQSIDSWSAACRQNCAARQYDPHSFSARATHEPLLLQSNLPSHPITCKICRRKLGEKHLLCTVLPIALATAIMVIIVEFHNPHNTFIFSITTFRGIFRRVVKELLDAGFFTRGALPQ